MPSTVLARIIGVVSVFVIAIGVWLSLSTRSFRVPEHGYPGGFQSPVLALELVTKPAEVALIAGELGDPRRALLVENTRVDFAFLAGYGLLFALVGWSYARTGTTRARIRGLVAIGTGVAASVADAVENLGILDVLSKSLAALSPEDLAAIREPSMMKWALVFLTAGVLSSAFRRPELTTAPRWIARLMLTSALVGLAGIARPQLFEPALLLLFAGLVVLALVALVRPEQLTSAAG
ncbi:hypothetical protein L6R52_10385 [Myxococcota bacterium]|nr:hypothetical protein [Myxococcota bacterium]